MLILKRLTEMTVKIYSYNFTFLMPIPFHICYQLSYPALPWIFIVSSLFFSFSLCFSISLSVYLYVCQPICLSICLPSCMSVCLPICLSVCMAICIFLYLSLCLSAFLSVSLPCPHEALSVFLRIIFGCTMTFIRQKI